MHSFADRLVSAILSTNSRVCVGLDPRVESLPGELRVQAQAGPEPAADSYRRFCCEIIDATAGLAPIVKPQAAFFEALGPPGYECLWDVMAHARQAGLLVILDAKRSDIGSTAAAYAKAYFDPPGDLMGPDAITVNGYLGSDGIKPFVDAAQACGGGVYVLAKTSNPSSGELQDRSVEMPQGTQAVYELMAQLIASWGRGVIGEQGYSSVGAVVGATYPAQLADLRKAVPSVPFLVPGYGAQGAGAEDIAGGLDEAGLGAVVSSSRGIIFAYEREPYASTYGAARYAEAAAAATREMRDAINQAIGV